MLSQSVLWRTLRPCRARKLAGVFVATALASALFPHGALAGDPDPKTWGGIGWGIGAAADFDLGGRRVTKAVAVNNIVRVDASGDVALGFVLEAHYFLRDWPGSDRVRNWVGSCGGTFVRRSRLVLLSPWKSTAERLTALLLDPSPATLWERWWDFGI